MVFATSTTSFSSLRPPLLRLARLGASYPIEVIVTVFCAVTLVYFQLLKVVRDSDFLLYDDALAPQPDSRHPFIHYSPASGLWSAVSPSSPSSPVNPDISSSGGIQLWMRQLVVEVPAAGIDPSIASDIKSTLDAATPRALDGLDCYKLGNSRTCWSVETQPTLNRTARSFVFNSAEASKEFATRLVAQPALLAPSSSSSRVALKRQQRARRGPRSYTSFFSRNTPVDGAGKTTDDSDTDLVLDDTWIGDEVNDGLFEKSREDMRSAKWMLFAARAFIMRFYGLAKKADSADIFVMLIAYLLMHSTFVSLFLNMRRLSLSLRPQSRSSGMWLASCALVSSCLAFMFSLLTAWYLEIAVNPVLLGEALPFLVITVGFEKPFVLTRAVFSNPAIGPSGAYSSGSRGTMTPRGADSLGLTLNNDRSSSSFSNGGPFPGGPGGARFGLRFAPPVPSRDIVLQAVGKTGVPIVRDYAIEVAVLVLGAMSGVAGLKEFCHLAALILCFDCLMLMGFYVAVLTIMVEVHRIKVMRHLRRTDSSADLARLLDDPTALPDDEQGSGSEDEEEDTKDQLTLRQKVVKLATGVAPGEKRKSDSPTARLKVLLLAAFLVLHALNLVTTLTRETALGRNREHAPSSPESPLIDTTLPLYSTSLAQLVSAHDRGTDLFVHIAPTMQYLAVDPSLSSSSVQRQLELQQQRQQVEERLLAETGSLAGLDRFMSRWTRLVGDPIISKWIVVALGISVFLNGYLLKGIASSDSGFHSGSAAEAAARILLASTGSVVDERDGSVSAADQKRLRHDFSLLRADLQEWTEKDAQAMKREYKREETKADAEAHKPAPEVVKVSAMSNGVSHKKATGDEPAADAAASTTTAEDDDSSEGSPPPSPILIRTKLRKAPSSNTTTSEATTTTSLDTSSAKPTLSLPAHQSAQREIKLSPSTVALVPLGQVPDTPRDLDICVKIFAGGDGALLLNDEEIIMLVQKGKIAAYALEKLLKDNERSVAIRRALISRASARKNLENSDLPYTNFDYSRVIGQCCENVVGFMPVPVGIAGPLRIDNEVVPVPMATCEGALVASTSRGCKALNINGGVTTVVTQDAMTRGPALTFPNVTVCATAKRWIDSEEGSDIMKASFNSTSRFARLKSLKSTMAGRTLYVRFATQTGDAMGMNMISKGTERALDTMQTEYFPEMRIASLSGNYCTDKKPAAINWIEGRGKSVVAEGVIPGEAVKSILKTTVKAIVDLNITKNLVGSAMAGTMGGNNAHAANILAAIFLATGQDIAQVVESANCITLMEAINDDQDLLITCSMPSIEVGTVGGGTILLPQGAMLDLLGVRGPHPTKPGENAQRLARIICASVLAGELSLMAALAAGSLVKSHLALNRSVPGTPAVQHTPQPSRPATPSAHGHVNGSAPVAFVSPQGRTVLTASTPIDPNRPAPARPAA